MCFICQSLDPKTTRYDTHGVGDMSTLGGPQGADAAGKPFFSLDQVAYQLTDGYWQSTNREWRAFDVQAGDTLTVNIDGLDAIGQATAMAALAAWTAVSGLQFQTTSGGADITFDDEDSGAYSWSSIYVGYNEIATSFVNVNTSWQNYGDYYHQTYIHEIGHALGLGHGGNYNGSADFGSQAHYANDSWQMSIMSYFAQWENPNVNASGNYLATAQMADILAIQNLYGTPDNVNTGNTVYGDNTNLALLGMDLNTDWAVTIFDSAGTDLINLGARGAHQRLDLRPESWSDLNGEIGNFAIARGAVIENAITGSGNDEIIGNDAANDIQTGSGADTLFGGAGNDTLNGGSGEDVAIFEGNPNGFAVGYDGGLTITDVDLSTGSDQGTDVLIGIETLSFTGGYTADVMTDGTTATVRFFAADTGVKSALVQLDVANSFEWSSIALNFVSGVRDSQVNTYDNGRVLEIGFTGGQRSSATMTDGNDVYGWSSYTNTYDAEGLLNTTETTLDDGKVVLTTYTDGVRSSALTTDASGAFSWATINRIFDTSGALTAQINTFDSGLVQEITYTAGLRSAISVTDGGNTAPWASYTDNFDSTGARISREMTHDNGLHVASAFSNGQTTSSILTDEADAFVWASVNRTWTAEGVLDTQVNTYDDGRVLEIDYVDGVRSSSLLTDNADAYAWASSAETYDSTGKLVERVMTWDNGTEIVTSFGEDAPLV
jgi:hypothetical protein